MYEQLIHFFSTSIRGNLMALLLLLVIACLMFSVISEALQRMHKGSVQIGLVQASAKEKRHGVAWVRDSSGRQAPIDFVADKPEHLVQPNRHLIAALFRQIEAMGLVPDHLEIMVGPRTQLFKAGNDKPVIAFTRPAW
jgi:hypothetical protein